MPHPPSFHRAESLLTDIPRRGRGVGGSNRRIAARIPDDLAGCGVHAIGLTRDADDHLGR